MIRTLLFLIFGALILIISFPFALVTWLFMKKGEYDEVPKAGIFFTKLLAKTYCWLGGCDYEIRGSENLPEGKAIFVGNHQGSFDTILVIFALGDPKIIMSKIENSFVPIANIWMKILKIIFVDRKHIKKAAKSMKKCEDYINHGFSALFFPEGTRSKRAEMGPFKTGAFKTAIDTNTPIVPFALDGTYHVWEEKGHIVKSKVILSILPAIRAGEMETSAQFAERTKELIQEELNRIRKSSRG